VQVAIEQALARYIIEGRGDLKRLTDREGYRMRVGASFSTKRGRRFWPFALDGEIRTPVPDGAHA
jgi:hypothetical protein